MWIWHSSCMYHRPGTLMFQSSHKYSLSLSSTGTKHGSLPMTNFTITLYILHTVTICHPLHPCIISRKWWLKSHCVSAVSVMTACIQCSYECSDIAGSPSATEQLLTTNLISFLGVCLFWEPVLSWCDCKQEVKVIWQKAPHGGPIPRLGVTPGGRKLYHWIPGVGFPISVP